MSRLFEGLVWSAAGFVGGFSLCWVMSMSATTKAVEGDVPSSRRVKRMDIVRAVSGVFILLMVVVSSYRYYQTTNCQTEYNRVVAESLSQRSEAQREEGLAQIDLLTATLSGNRDAAIQQTQKYIEAVRELERVRAASPLPEPPDCRKQP